MATLISVRVTDAEGKTTPIPYYFPDSVDTVAAAQGKLDTLAPLLDGLIDSVITGAEVSFGLDLPSSGIKTSAVAGSRTDAGATLSYRNSAGRAWSHYLPSFKASALVNEEVVLTDVISYNAAMVGALIASDDNGLDLTSYRQGKQSRRKV
jgi:hypothetical protein